MPWTSGSQTITEQGLRRLPEDCLAFIPEFLDKVIGRLARMGLVV